MVMGRICAIGGNAGPAPWPRKGPGIYSAPGLEPAPIESMHCCVTLTCVERGPHALTYTRTLSANITHLLTLRFKPTAAPYIG